MNKIINPSLVVRAEPRPLRVTMLGIRGFPGLQGGAETHAEKLSCALTEIGCRVEAVVRSGYVKKGGPAIWRDIVLARVWAPRVTGLEAFVHTFLGVLRAACKRPDICTFTPSGRRSLPRSPARWVCGLSSPIICAITTTKNGAVRRGCCCGPANGRAWPSPMAASPFPTAWRRRWPAAMPCRSALFRTASIGRKSPTRPTSYKPVA